jgi:2-polyprenyl-6-methoxyphenol hydroxylase-like FAD-dependent oxidoreductase
MACREAWSAMSAQTSKAKGLTMSTMGSGAPRRVLIVGAGIAGLATALRLRRSAWDIVLVERASSLRGGGYMIGFSGMGYRAADELGLLPALRKLQPPATDLLYVNHAGRQQAVMPVEAQQAMVGEETLALLRGDLETTLFQALRECGDGGSGNGVDIRFATTVADIEQDADGVTATLSDGRQERVDLLVGADGQCGIWYSVRRRHTAWISAMQWPRTCLTTPRKVSRRAARFRWTWLGVA